MVLWLKSGEKSGYFGPDMQWLALFCGVLAARPARQRSSGGRWTLSALWTRLGADNIREIRRDMTSAASYLIIGGAPKIGEDIAFPLSGRSFIGLFGQQRGPWFVASMGFVSALSSLWVI